MAESYQEKRREPRYQAEGGITFRHADGTGGTMQGRLIDVSETGFRAAHGDALLVRGQEIFFEHEKGQGKARAIWNRILDGEIQTGFLIVSAK